MALIREKITSLAEMRSLSHLHVYTDFLPVSEIAGQIGDNVSGCFINEDPVDDKGFFPNGTRSALKHFLEDSEKGGDLAVFDFRNLLAGPKELDEAAWEFKLHRPELMVGMRALKDHPTNVYRYHKVIDVCIAHVFEEVEGEWRSRPFKLGCDTAVMRLGWEMDGGRSLTEVESSRDERRPEIVWTSRDREQAHLRFPQAGASQPRTMPLLCLGYGANYTEELFVLRIDTGSKEVRIEFGKDWRHPSGVEMRLIPFGEQTLDFARSMTLACDSWEPTAIYDGLDDSLSGFAVIILLPVDLGEYDIKEPMSLGGAPWRNDLVSGDILDGKTGERITGRQQLPEVLTAGGGVVFIRSDAVRDAILGGDASTAAFFRLTDKASLQVNGPFQLLAYQAYQRIP